MELMECFERIGFTRHEALLYLLLCREGPATGYEAAKNSGITRSNAYLALAGLVEKGGALRVEGEPVRYDAVPVRELTANLRRSFEESLIFIAENIPEKAAASEPFYTVTGERNVVDKMKNMILHSAERLYISISQSEWGMVDPELRQVTEKGLKVVVVTDFPLELSGAVVYRHHKQAGQIRLIVDSSEVLSGEIGTGREPNVLYSRNGNLVQLLKDALKNEIKLVEMGN